MHHWRLTTALSVLLLVMGCGGSSGTPDAGSGSDSGVSPDSGTGGATPDSGPLGFMVGGTIDGLTGTGMVLQNNGGETLPVTPNSNRFTFPTLLSTGAAYAVTVQAQPAGQTCTVADGAGTVASADVTTVRVACANNGPTVGGAVHNLRGTLVLQSGEETLTLTGSAAPGTTYAFQSQEGAFYSVSVQAHPAGQTCSVVQTRAAGTVPATGVVDADVTCEPNAVVLSVGPGGPAPAPGTLQHVGVTLQEFRPTGGPPVRTVAAPSTVSLLYNGAGEGSLSRSSNGRFLAFAVYNGTDRLSSNRAVLSMDASGTLRGPFDVGPEASVFTNQSPRGAVTEDGTSFWVAGGGDMPEAGGSRAGGVWYLAPGAQAVQVSDTSPVPDATAPILNNARTVAVYGGRLWVSSTSTPTLFNGVSQVGTGLPTLGGQTTQHLMATSGVPENPFGFAFVSAAGSPDLEVLYVAYDTPPSAANTIHLRKFVLDAASGTPTWTEVSGFAPTWALPSVGARAVAAERLADGSIRVYMVTGTATAPGGGTKGDDDLVTFIDNGTTKTPAARTVVEAALNFNMRGVALAPIQPAP